MVSMVPKLPNQRVGRLNPVADSQAVLQRDLIQQLNELKTLCTLPNRLAASVGSKLTMQVVVCFESR